MSAMLRGQINSAVAEFIVIMFCVTISETHLCSHWYKSDNAELTKKQTHMYKNTYS